MCGLLPASCAVNTNGTHVKRPVMHGAVIYSSRERSLKQAEPEKVASLTLTLNGYILSVFCICIYLKYFPLQSYDNGRLQRATTKN